MPMLIKKILDRYDPALEQAQTIHFPKLAYEYFQSLKHASPNEASNIKIQIGKKFCQKIIQHGLGNANVIYGFDGASLELFDYAKSRGIRCILDQTIAERSLIHKLLLEEEQIWSGWSKSPFQLYDSDLKLAQRQQDEQNLADHIICGSSFVKESLITKGINSNKISVVSLGRCQDNQLSRYSYEKITAQERGDGLRILFAGLVCLRKGIPYLLHALRHIKGKIPFTCKVTGIIEIRSEKVNEFRDVCEFIGLVPRSKMKELYAWADVFVLPSICEGSAMVTYEALYKRLPVITTPNAGSIIRDGIDGFIVPIRNTSVIAEKLLYIYRQKLNQNHVFDSDINYLDQIYDDSKNKLMQAIINGAICQA